MSYKKQFILAAILFFNSIAFGQNYITQLNKINQFLKTFDNGYYGYLEIKDGYLYDRFPSGKYSKSEIKYLGKAREEELKRKVVVDCLSEKDCVYSTYTNSYHAQISFSQSTDFNTSTLIALLNELLDAYKNKGTQVNIETTKTKPDTTDITIGKILRNQPTRNTNEQIAALKAINDYLKIFNPEVYKNVEIKEGKVVFNFIVYTKIYVSSIDINELKLNTITVRTTDQVKIGCKNEKKCFYSTYANGNVDHFRFYSNTVKDLSKMEQLVNDLIKSL
ncbi:MAG: hypothetical protein IPP53_07485 [Bacteroidetes bacterium]|nr:hypothetical protein [Bacteroidota bacterium]